MIRLVAGLAASTALAVLAGSALVIAYDVVTMRWQHTIRPQSPECGQSKFVADELSGYRVRPNRRCDKRNIYMVNGKPVTIVTPVYHDSRGARVSGPNEETPDRIDMIVVGGSQTWGQGVRQNETFASVLGQMSGRKSANFGVSGTGGVSAYHEAMRNMDLRPEWLVYGFWQDHLNRNVRYCANTGLPTCTPLPRVVFDHGGNPSIDPPANPARELSLTRQYIETMAAGTDRTVWQNVLWSLRARMRQLDEVLHPQAYDKATPAHKISAANFVHREMAKRAKERGAQLVVAYIPLYFADTIQPADPRLIEAAKKDGYLFVDTGDELARLRNRGKAIAIPGDGHLTVEGHRAVAEQVHCAIMKAEAPEHRHRSC